RRLAEEMGDQPETSEDEIGGEGAGGGSRVATLLPIFRWVIIAIIAVAAIMIILSEFGLDIGPIFAGAGVVGIAVGFGAQKLIQDVFSGAFFLLDDAFRKGEYVEIDAVKGVVEKISIRSFQLRHHLGALHTIPFGEIRQLTNYSRDWVMMKLPLRVTYDTDVEKVRKLVKKLGQRLLEHDQVGHTFLQPLKSQGVYKMEDSAMIIRVKFMTKPGEQFVTRKIVYQEIQDLFAREGIHFAHKEVTVRLADGASADSLTEEQKEAVGAAARSVIDQEEEALAAAGGKPA
ncbi:MAG: mechanosensitive ion channel family protein, partial [Pseudomonadota bacterium]